jgi:hypothetical protein
MARVKVVHFSAGNNALYVIDDQGRIWKRHDGTDSVWQPYCMLPAEKDAAGTPE